MHYYGTIRSGDFLAHHGVIGMRWGIRHDRRVKSTGRAYKAKRKALRKDKTLTREQRKEERSKSKEEWLSAREDAANRLYPLNSKGLNRKLARDSTANALAKAAIFGDLGAAAYNSQRGRGRSRVVATAAGGVTRAAMLTPAMPGLLGASMAYGASNEAARRRNARRKKKAGIESA
jgi:hypothetical protein